MIHYPAYAVYKDTGIEWLGKIPEHWEIKKLRYICQINVSNPKISQYPNDMEVSFLPMERIGEDSKLSLEETQPIGNVRQGYTYFQDGDIIIAKITPCFENGKGALCHGLINGFGFGTTELHVLRPKKQIHPKFIYYLTKSHAFMERGTAAMSGSAGQQRVPEDFVSNFRFGIPPASEQCAIVAFLDHKLSMIDRFVKNRENLITHLRNKKIILASNAITRHINSGMKLKLSGIKWLNEIPEHWEVKKAMYYFKEIDERSETGDEELLSVSHITGVTPRKEKNVTMFMAESYEGYKMCQPGDLVINIMWAWMGALGVSTYRGIVSSSYGVYRQRKNFFNWKYLDYLLRTRPYVAEFISRSTGIRSSRLRMYTEDFFGIPIIRPPLDEQERIVRYIEQEHSQIDSAISKAESEINSIKKFRTVLITEAVTGNINVQYIIKPKEILSMNSINVSGGQTEALSEAKAVY